ncbi:polysaccharide deacetylase family protein [Alteriqipengyuania lutimaris]|uniref:Chitooligosaccharide deacetylase n=1 Tax=Alteriqipengyuania lutimaris TaxID=1538146 RepID=A0A395LIZ4_9SPHN|nr:polysaccharide deacetylase family protein [Alteriqipengyuania lutimaris]MBB3034903.1 peptidoglycan/xylan/chitin deacetylase (PgdA/CDA1 family) [Alteriqipengyuania lutimaris]RDS76267.1 polysaccharide deacetylase [Alteriqipengyuania lutimaris]
MIRVLVSAFLALMICACAHAEDTPEAPARTPEKRIALSFDDAPRAPGAFLTEDERTRLLIENLAEAGVEQAAFFVNPGQIDSAAEERRVMAYVAAGHVIANHTATHPRLSQTGLAEYIADIDAAEEWLQGREGYRPWFRYPYLDEGQRDTAKRDAVRAALAQRGLVNGYVTVDASDWFYEGAAKTAASQDKDIDREALRDLYVETQVEAAEFYDTLAREAIGRSPVHMLLLHETDIAALWIGDLVAALEAKGWTIVSADKAYADPFAQYARTYDTPSAQGALTEMVAWEKGLPAPRWYRGNNTDLAQQWFDTRVLGETRDGGD